MSCTTRWPRASLGSASSYRQSAGRFLAIFAISSGRWTWPATLSGIAIKKLAAHFLLTVRSQTNVLIYFDDLKSQPKRWQKEERSVLPHRLQETSAHCAPP